MVGLLFNCSAFLPTGHTAAALRVRPDSRPGTRPRIRPLRPHDRPHRMKDSLPPFRAFLPLEETLFDVHFTCPDLGEYTIGLAQTFEDRTAAFRLVYDEYVKKGFVPADVEALWYSAHDLLPETTTFVVKRGAQTCQTMSVVADAELGLPCEDLFPEEIRTLRAQGRRLVEVGSLAGGIPGLRTSGYAMAGLIRLMKLTVRAQIHGTDLIIAVNPRHVEFYRRKLLFEVLAGPRSFEKVNGAPAVLMRLDLERAPARYLAAFGADSVSSYVQYYQPNLRQTFLVKWLWKIRKTRSAQEVEQYLEAGLHRRLLNANPRLAEVLADLFPALAERLGVIPCATAKVA